MFWAVLHVQLGSGELLVKSLVPWIGWCKKTVDFSHLMAPFSKDYSQNSPLPIWSRRLGGPTSAEGLGALPTRVWVYRHGLRCPRLYMRRFGGGTETFSPSHVPCKSHCCLCHLSPAPCQPPKHFRIFLSHSSDDQHHFNVGFVLAASGSHI